MQEILWQPSDHFINRSNLKKFEQWLTKHRVLSFKDYEDLWQWSVDHVEDFWEALYEYFELIDHGSYQKVLSTKVMPGAEWFKGTKLNYAEHIFRNKTEDKPALYFKNEILERAISWKELEDHVIKVRHFLIEQGIKPGDRVAGYLPNIPEAVISFLAVNSIGAIWSCCSPDFGVDTVIERFSQIEPKLIIASDGYRYNGKPYDRRKELAQIIRAIPSIQQSIFIPYLVASNQFENGSLWEDVISKEVNDVLSFTAVPFDHPIWILYSSGTTGKPKAITHSHGGVLLEHLKYLAFHNDVHAGEYFFWYSTTGWMMWNFLQASMLMGGIPVLFDGSPGYPNMNVLWDLSAKLPIAHFGTSAPYLTACMKRELAVSDNYDLSALRSIGSTGAPLPPEVFGWIYKNISEDIWLCSMSGGTDVCTAFVGGNPYLPVLKGNIQSRALGCALYAYDEEGNKVKNALGEMVIEQPMPSMPIYFWNDENLERYKSSYFEHYPNKWRHGDWIKIYDNGSLMIQGRSDATLNRKGIRIGTAEIYNALDDLPEIKDALILNLERSDGEDIMPLYVVLRDDTKLSLELQDKIKKHLRTHCSPRHVPDHIYQAPDIPYTLSGKKMEVPVKKLFMHKETASKLNKEAIRNPAAMDYFIEIAKEF